jgi:phage shock protein PspC (stress-responsive transcriptional regulator)
MQKTEADKPTPPPSTGERFFAWMRSLGIQREKGWVGGVAAGIAVRTGIDPLIVRGIFVVAALLGAPALIVYAAAWLLLPDIDDEIHLERAIKGQFDAPLAAIGVTIVLGLLPIAPGFWFWSDGWPFTLGRTVWTLALLGLAIWFVVWLAQRGGVPSSTVPGDAPKAPPSSAPASEFAAWREQQAAWREENAAFRRQEADAKAAAWRLKNEESQARHREAMAERQAAYRASSPHPLWSLLAIGLALVAGGITTLVFGDGELEAPAVLSGLAVALGVLGLAIVVNGVRGKRGGGPSAIAWLLAIPLVFVLVLPQVSSVTFAGDRTVAPVDLPGGRPDFYFVGSGDLTVDLRDFYEHSKGSTSDDVYVFVGSGDVEVLLPEGEVVDLRASIGSGEVYLTGPDGVTREYDDEYDNRRNRSDRQIDLRIFIGSGDVTLIEEKN